MPFEFIQIPANGQGSAKEELNKLLRNGRIASVKKEFVSNGEDSFWAFCIEFLDGVLGSDKGRGGGPKIDYKEVVRQHGLPPCPQLRPTVPDGATMSMGLNRPPSRSCPLDGCDKITNRPSGAGSPADAGSNAPGGQVGQEGHGQPARAWIRNGRAARSPLAAAHAKPSSNNDRRGRLSSLTAGTAVFHSTTPIL